MPSTSKKQADFMRAAAHNPKFAKKAGVKSSVAKDFYKADKKKGKYQRGGLAQVQDQLYRPQGSAIAQPAGSVMSSAAQGAPRRLGQPGQRRNGLLDTSGIRGQQANQRLNRMYGDLRRFAKGGKVKQVTEIRRKVKEIMEGPGTGKEKERLLDEQIRKVKSMMETPKRRKTDYVTKAKGGRASKRLQELVCKLDSKKESKD